MSEQNEAVVQADASDVEKNKGIAALAYLIFFLPLLTAKDSAYAKYHANQGLVLLLLGIAVSIVGSIIPFLGWFLILPVGGIFTVVLFVMGIVNAMNGKCKPLPLIGKLEIIK